MFQNDTAIMFFHINHELEGFDMHGWSEKLPQFWKLFESSLDGSPADGFYDWEDADGVLRQKYMYIVPVKNTDLMVAATTYVDEFLKPVQETKERITAAAQTTSTYIEQQKNMMQSYFVIAIFIMLAIVTGIAIWLAKIFSRPILALTKSSRALGNGDLEHRVQIGTNDEIGELGQQFNAMADALKDLYSTMEQKVEEHTRSERRRADELRAINEMGRKISSILSMDELLLYAVNSLRQTFKYDSVIILLIDPDTGELVLHATASADTGQAHNMTSAKISEGAAAWVARTGEPFLANDISKEPRCSQDNDKSVKYSELAIPIKVANEMKGVLDIQSKELYSFDELDLFTAQTVADQLAIAIENARLYKETRDIAVLEERNRMAREIHDTLAQGFTGIILQLEAAELAIGSDTRRTKEYLQEAVSLARDSLNEARRSVWALHPKALEQLPLA